MQTMKALLPASCLLLAALASPDAHAQPRAPSDVAQAADAMPMADYLGLLRQIAPAAEEGARDYLRAIARRCGHLPDTSDLRGALARGDGDPVLMGLIRAHQLRDAGARDQWLAQVRCPGASHP